MTAAAAEPTEDVLARLRGRVAAMERGTARQRLPTLPALDDVVPLHAGGVYGVDSAGLALALAAGASAAGEWVGFAGWRDFGSEAAAALGIRLDRTVLVPEPGEHWLEVTAALVDVLKVVVLRPPARSGPVAAKDAGRLESRLRTRSSVLVVWGEWPRVEARVSLERSAVVRGRCGPGSAGGAAVAARRPAGRPPPTPRRPVVAEPAPGRRAGPAGRRRSRWWRRSREGAGGLVPRLVRGRRAGGGRAAPDGAGRGALGQRRAGVQRPGPRRGGATRSPAP